MKKLKQMKWVALVGTVVLIGGCSQRGKTGSESSTTAAETSKEKAVSVVRETAFGKVKGLEEENALVWLGVPYGGDTSGENRWKAPTDPESWTGELDVSEAGSPALQVRVLQAQRMR